MLEPFLIVLCNMLKSIGWLDYSDAKMAGSCAEYLFGEDLEAILSYIVSHSFDESLESTSMLQKHLLKSRLKKRKLTHVRNAPKHCGLQEGCSFIFFFTTEKKKIFTLSIMRLSYPKLNWNTLFSKAMTLFE